MHTQTSLSNLQLAHRIPMLRDLGTKDKTLLAFGFPLLRTNLCLEWEKLEKSAELFLG